MVHLLTSSSGWGKKLSYCIAFSADGCCDVTRRYVRNPAEQAVPRTKCPEGVLTHIIREINAMRRQDMDKKQKFQLNADDMREDAELRKYVIESIAFNVSKILPGGGEKSGLHGHDRNDPDAQKAAEGREMNQTERVRTTRSESPRSQQQHQPQSPPHDPWPQ